MNRETGPKPLTEEDDVSLERELRMQLGAEATDTVEIFNFGLDVQRFLEASPVGKYIVTLAERDAAEGLMVITAAVDLDTDEVRKAHMQVKVAQGILGMLSDAIMAGTQAEDSLKSEDMMDQEQDDG